MPRVVKPLGALEVKAAVSINGKVRKLSDGNGLQLWVMPDGRKYWRADVRVNGKRSQVALGVYPTISLADARLKAAAARKLASEGKDPVTHRRSEKLAQKANSGNTFEVVARLILARAASKNRSAATLDRARWILGKFSKPFMETPIAELELRRLKQEILAHEASGSGEILRCAAIHHCQRADRARVALQHAGCIPAAAQAPQLDLASVKAPSRDTVSPESGSAADPALPRGRRLLQLLARQHVPHAQHAIAPAAGHAPAAHVHNSTDCTVVSRERPQASAVRQAPYAESAVPRTSHHQPRSLRGEGWCWAQIAARP